MVELDISYENFNEAVGYKKMAVIQGFNVLEGPRADAVLTLVGAPPAVSKQGQEAVEAVEWITGNSHAQGRSSDAQLNKAIERHAVDKAKKYFQGLKWVVNEVGKPYDLKCTKDGHELRVEVKGSSGAAKTVVLTVNEVTHAESFPEVALVVVSNIKYARMGGKIVCSGGDWFLAHPWKIADDGLRPLVFDYQIP